MSAIVVLIGISLVVAVLFLLVFVWAVRSNQYDDTYTPSVRILFDEHDHGNSKQADGSTKCSAQ